MTATLGESFGLPVRMKLKSIRASFREKSILGLIWCDALNAYNFAFEPIKTMLQ